jgi:hypothetical protein
MLKSGFCSVKKKKFDVDDSGKNFKLGDSDKNCQAPSPKALKN